MLLSNIPFNPINGGVRMCKNDKKRMKRSETSWKSWKKEEAESKIAGEFMVVQ